MEEYYFWPDVHEGLRDLYLRTHFANNLGGFFPALKNNPEQYILKRSDGKWCMYASPHLQIPIISIYLHIPYSRLFNPPFNFTHPLDLTRIFQYTYFESYLQVKQAHIMYLKLTRPWI